ncbi:MAG: EamA family transporter [Gammaproteobacteria bacterium]|uniref:DMT family transporter n=1 Tax=Hydrogenophaga sp. TaxID=1904254 RepID=UPI0025C564B2|nr:EamA family transporter [Hydrogenophaga sp.]MBU4181344.1 EamA family transporter [Gammaproteobacteria bacterium]MBU4279742.1 EamA family transporter [Gammaproteobacteria bacterium]MBU4323538.1 EamA family transporter [Gammaproteobacteria bacterium]MBU4507761.1 EamA family transporter [Gammaproteobacteria bacterium]MCG2654088.1 EamA family transporter [Hydrogenophaga sp.]
MHALSRQQLILLVLLTLVWGLNWPIMKLGVTGFPPLSFRSICMWLGLPVLGLFLVWRKVPFRIDRVHWRELAVLTVTNMFFWHTLAILAIQSLSSGRAAILGYTMPVFSALLGAAWFGQRLAGRAWFGVAAAALGVVLLLWHEVSTLSGRPLGVFMMLVAAATWALGTQLMRRTRIAHPTLAISFWMTVATTLWMTLLAVVFERDAWTLPSEPIWGAIVYNAIGVFAFAQVVWLMLARDLPPIASTLSVMFIPVLGVFSGAWWLGEVLHWQDWTAVVLVMLAIATVLWPARPASPALG